MAHAGSERSLEEKFGKFIHQFKHEIKIHVRKLERSMIKLYRGHVSISFNQNCLKKKIFTYVLESLFNDKNYTSVLRNVVRSPG